jgi:ferric-dicitrate binding protein FerR (iron transport regulator)
VGETPDTSSRLFAAIRRVQADQLRLDDGHERARARARLLQSIDAQSAASGRASSAPQAQAMPWRWVMGGLVAAACSVALVIGLPGEQPPTLDSEHELVYAIDGSGEFGSDRTIVADAGARVLEFDDGTRVELAAQGELRVADLRSNGATIRLDHGEVALSVHHEDDTSWQVAAGPWSVHVTGTQFSVAWNPTTEHFRVAVIEGSVRVEGPEGDVAKLRAGESLVRERSESSEVASREAIVSPPEVDTAALVEPSEPVEAPADPTPVKPSKLDKQVDWQALAKDSKYAEAWAALEDSKGGVLGEAERVDAKAMIDLADVARFTEHRGDAKKVLERLRERFAGSVQAGDAAFELGRIAADGGNDDQAASWFETYLDERPNGTLVNDALVRLMNAYDSLDRADDAASAATRYLARQPDGPHAGRARKILGK